MLYYNVYSKIEAFKGVYPNGVLKVHGTDTAAALLLRGFKEGLDLPSG
jgi:hypothetical protein